MHEHFERLKSALRRDNMVLNCGKQQVLGLTKEVRTAWGHTAHPVKSLKDWGPVIMGTMTSIQKWMQAREAADHKGQGIRRKYLFLGRNWSVEAMCTPRVPSGVR